ncbi:MAG TPA: T9SS type A sorting domain-containing protein [Puia sp.]|nr:T9SS type A sorting domain-containing protein [Puia sp.]
MNNFTQGSRKAVLAGLIFFVSALSSFGQTESNAPVTYDTTITEKYLNNKAYTWNVRITRQKNDKSLRPVIFFIPGSGEVGTNTAKLTTYGPHYWLKNGWDGGIKIGNGTHYPILVTIQQPKANMRPWDLKLVFEALLKILPVKLNSVHVSGISQGSYEWGELISYSAFSGDHAIMSEIKSWVDLEGVGPASDFSGFNLPYPSVFGYWANHYGGKFFGLEGSSDDRGVWQISENINANKAGAAFFSYQNIGGGEHCCWNSMLDPSATDWSGTGSNIVSNSLHPNTQGTYKKGSNIFQWILRQGDTSMVSGSADTTKSGDPEPVTAPTVNAGSAQSVTLPAGTVNLSGTATTASGTTLSSQAWTQKSGPSTARIVTANELKTSITGLVTGTYIFTLTVKNSLGAASSSDVAVTVLLSAATAPVVGAGGAQTITLPVSSANLSGTATAVSGTSLTSESWTQQSGPSTAKFGTPGKFITPVTGLEVGNYVFTFTVKNSLGQTASSNVTVTVKAKVINTAPVVSAGSAQTITLPVNSVNLSATATAASGTSLTSGLWAQSSGPSKAVIATPTNTLKTKVTSLVTGTYIFTLTAKNNLGQTASSSVTVTVKEDVATTPKVNAGTAQTITLPVNSVNLSATATAASGTTLTSGLWAQSSGPSKAVIATPTNTLKTKVTSLVTGTYIFTLTAKNSLGQTTSSSVAVTVNAVNTAPVVNAGSAQSITAPASSTFLQATATAASGTSLSSETWVQTSGPSAATINRPANSLSTAISGLLPGTYVFTITVKNNLGETASSSVAVTVISTAAAPVVGAGSAQTITLPVNSVNLSGTATAASGTTLTLESWTQQSGPSTAVFTAPGKFATAVTGLVAGIYTFKFTVTNNQGKAGSNTVTVTVVSAATAPVVGAGSAQTVTLPVSPATLSAMAESVSGTATTNLNGTATAASGTTLTLESWTQQSGPSTAVFTAPGKFATAVTGLVAGTYVFKFTVTNNLGQTGSNTVTVTVVSVDTTAPVVGAGSAQTITLPVNSVNLSGTATAASGTTLTLESWTQQSGPSNAVFTAPGKFATAVTGLVAGTYAFIFAVTNNLGQTSSGSVTITVNSASVASSALQTIVSTGEYQTLFIDKNKYLWAVGANLSTQGSNFIGTPGIPVRVLTTPANLKFKAAASSLHGGIAVDTAGYVWTWGQGESGEIGNGQIYADQVLTPVRLTTDNTGKTFTGIEKIYAYYSNNASVGLYAIKDDGTLWIWGDTRQGMMANGTAGGFVTRPTQIVIPGNRKALQLAAGNTLDLLCTDGTVWTCGGGIAGVNPNLGYRGTGNDYMTLHQLDLPANIVEVAGATNQFNYALTSTGVLYGWGSYSSYMGGTGGYAANTYFYTPVDLTTRLNLPYPVKSVVGNMVCTHAILTDGSLWGWGDNSCGSVGNGKELDFSQTATPYSWDFHPADLLQQAPVQISTRKDFVAVWGAGPFVLFDFAETADGQLYSWGRNKGAVLANGVMGCTPDVQADYPNSWDVTSPTAVNPFSLTRVNFVASPYCTKNTLLGLCPACLLALNINLTPNVVATLSTTTAAHSVAATTSTVQAAIANPGGLAVQTTATNAEGAAVQTTAEVQQSATTSSGEALTTGQPLTVQALSAFSDVSLDGSQSADIDGKIVSYSWSQVQGPRMSVITDSTAASTTARGLVPGTYVFRLSVTDDKGASAAALDTLIIESAGQAPSGPGIGTTQGLLAYPNPAHDNLNLVLSSDKIGNVRVNIYNALGMLVKADQFDKEQKDMYKSYPVGQLAPGMYIVQVLISNEISLTTKFVKQ